MHENGKRHMQDRAKKRALGRANCGASLALVMLHVSGRGQGPGVQVLYGLFGFQNFIKNLKMSAHIELSPI